MKRTHYGQHDNCFGCKILTLTLTTSTESFQPHFNWAVGEWVETRRDFEDKLKICSDRASTTLGIDHDFQPRYGGEASGTTLEGLDEGNRIRHDALAADNHTKTFISP